MKETIKKALIFGLVSSITMIIVGISYAAVHNVSNGTPLTSTLWNTIMGNYEYSTSEVDTGKKWIDGKPIYRKVFELPAGSFNNSQSSWGSVSFNNSGDNVEKVVSAEVDFNNIHEYYTFENSVGTAHFRYYISKNGLSYTNKHPDNSIYVSSATTAIVIMEYTKTTDI